MHDDLLRPVLANRAAAGQGQRPWRLGSQAWVALLGGPIAATAIAILNARRLRLETRQQLTIAAAGLAGMAAAIALSAALGPGSDQRLVVRGVAVLAWGGMYLVQRVADRTFAFHEGDEAYESLWIPGVLAVVLGGLIQWPLVTSAAGGWA